MRIREIVSAVMSDTNYRYEITNDEVTDIVVNK